MSRRSQPDAYRLRGDVMKSTRQRAIELAKAAAALPVADRCLVAMYLLQGVIPPPDDDHEERDDLIRRIRSTWLGRLADEPAAARLEQEVNRYAAGEFRSAEHANASEVPRSLRGSLKADLWRLLKLGRPLGKERYRQIFRTGNARPIEITSERAES
jgi:hypothetical protein